MFDRGRGLALALTLIAGCAGVAEGEVSGAAGAESTWEITRAAVVRSTPSTEGVAAIADADSTLRWCPGRATRRLRMRGNLHPGMGFSSPWLPSEPEAASHTWSDVLLFAAEGYPIATTFYFGNQGGFFTYHVLAGSAGVEIGSGALYFDASGALQYVKELRPLRLVGPDGVEAPLGNVFGTPTSKGGTGLDGMTSESTWDQISAIEQDGAPRIAGHSCPDGVAAETNDEGDAATAPVGLTACPGRPSTRVAIQANLSAIGPILSMPWDPLDPATTSSFGTSFLATGAGHALAAFDLFFRRVSHNQWEYLVSLQSEQPRPEVGRGMLEFHGDGTLSRVEVAEPLRFPDPSGAPGAPIVLDFGTPTFDGGSGVGGVTAYPMASFLISSEQDGTRPSIDSSCPVVAVPPRYMDFPAPLDSSRYYASLQPVPACAGAMSRYGSLSLLFDSNLPIDDASWDPRAPLGASELIASAMVYDSALRAIPLNVRARRISHSSWEVRVSTDERGELVERAAAVIDVDDSGLLAAHIEGELRVSLPLDDGREGSSIDLELPTPLDEGGNSVVSIPGQSFIGLWVNGSAATGCPEL
jgi:hypothetical protein